MVKYEDWQEDHIINRASFYFHFEKNNAHLARGRLNIDGLCHSRTGEVCRFIKKLPVNFGKIDGSFYINNFLKITSLIGCPGVVSGAFEAIDLKFISSLRGAPSNVMSFHIDGTNITSLRYSPNVKKFFSCRSTPINTLSYSPENLLEFACDDCKNLTTFLGGPKKVNIFMARGCDNLTSIEGLPEEFEQIFLTFKSNLPLLRLIATKGKEVYLIDHRYMKDRKISNIINTWLTDPGSAKSRVLNCQQALLDAGFSGNALW